MTGQLDDLWMLNLDVYLASFSTLNVNITETFGDVGLWSFDPLSGYVETTGNVGAATFSIAMIHIFADESAFLYAVDGLNGTLDALDDALLISLGYVSSSITGGIDADVLSYQVVFNSDITAGRYAVLVTFGSVSSSSTLDSGSDVVVVSVGDFQGSVTSGGDASVTTHGDFDAGLFADRDIGFDDFYSSPLPGVWARGSIKWTIFAGRNVGNEIFSHDSIDGHGFQSQNSSPVLDRAASFVVRLEHIS